MPTSVWLQVNRFLAQRVRQIHICNRDIPASIPLPPYVTNSGKKSQHDPPKVPVVHTEDAIADLRTACSFVRDIFTELENFIRPGLSTQDIDDFVYKSCISKQVYPSPLNYHGFPKSVCTSINEVACHGIPASSVFLCPGDLLSVDISVYTGHAHGDSCRSYVIDSLESMLKKMQLSQSAYRERAKRSQFLCAVAKSCCEAAIRICGPGVPYSEIAQIISLMADNQGCRVVAGIRGHGVGNFLHGPPDIKHSVYELLPSTSEPDTDRSSDALMKSGHVFTIEPCIALADSNAPKPEAGSFMLPAVPVVLDDQWTVVTADRALTAQFEHTILITDSGHSVLT
ncbi:unnamed protein product [Calicophoron daubneyi]|uniref:Peptidase M24 domain-containing protein n=1 Tax=Calicophoron daubneyi TaxID=300641 RepID=A0AAV2TRN8_CALDB